MSAGSSRRRVFVPQALGSDDYLRATWHEGKQVVVISHWSGDTCVAAIPVRVCESGELASLLVDALAADASERSVDWAPPHPAHRVA